MAQNLFHLNALFVAENLSALGTLTSWWHEESILNLESMLVLGGGGARLHHGLESYEAY